MRVYLNDKIEYHKDGTATVSKMSGISGQTHTMIMRMHERQYKDWTECSMLIQDALPQLSAAEREFLMTGITPAEWKATFGEE